MKKNINNQKCMFKNNKTLIINRQANSVLKNKKQWRAGIPDLSIFYWDKSAQLNKFPKQVTFPSGSETEDKIIPALGSEKEVRTAVQLLMAFSLLPFEPFSSLHLPESNKMLLMFKKKSIYISLHIAYQTSLSVLGYTPLIPHTCAWKHTYLYQKNTK